MIHDFPAGICTLSFLQKFNYPPMIFMTAYTEFNFISSVTKTTLTPSFYPYVALSQLESTFLSRVENMLLHTIDYLYFTYVIFPKLDEVVSTSFENLPPLLELAERNIITIFNYNVAVHGMYTNRISFIFKKCSPVVSSSLDEGMKQLPPNVIPVGGLQIEKPKALTGV